ncbi:YhfC family intramembrane metalloprotease [Cohnella endophytica]|uniref:YhfC family intramembrane metalloprotease n=1 Tax=Cohnella endophytica TaxID=2419778 RepID=A0A494XM00_9BACL|nr:YhfC family glutamic-type intramembrane protease [Cohnella endophytica]RKP51720.1 YhfC family intramembrane metalloprotease [Cohnella endophytica]
MNTTVEHQGPSYEAFNQATRRSLLVLPLFILVPFLFGVGFWAAGYVLEWRAFGLGALGWFIALVLRAPLSAIVMKMPQEKAKNIIVASSGILEESARLVLLAVTSVVSSWAVSVGQGWAAVEVLFTIVNIVVIASLVKRTDEKAVQAKQFLESQSTIHASPLWGVLERIWASAFHIGCTLIVAFHPWSVVLLIPLHSSLNWFAVRLAARSVWKSSLFVAVIGVITLLVGILFISL